MIGLYIISINLKSLYMYICIDSELVRKFTMIQNYWIIILTIKLACTGNDHLVIHWLVLLLFVVWVFFFI